MEPLELGEVGIKVGTNPDPQPAQPAKLIVEFDMMDGSQQSQVFDVPSDLIVRAMGLRVVRGEKDLGLVFRTSFVVHDDSKRLHTLCQRDSAEIEQVEW